MAVSTAHTSDNAVDPARSLLWDTRPGKIYPLSRPSTPMQKRDPDYHHNIDFLRGPNGVDLS